MDSITNKTLVWSFYRQNAGFFVLLFILDAFSFLQPLAVRAWAILYRCRQLENTRLMFYRALSVPQAARLGQYALFYLLLLLPEMLVLGWLTPHPIRVSDTITFLLSGYSVLLLLNSILYTAPITNRVFLRLCLLIFGILYCCVLGNYLILLSEVFLVTATVLFFRGYARYEMGRR